MQISNKKATEIIQGRQNYFAIITARQRSCKKVMFSQVFVCPRGGGDRPPPPLEGDPSGGRSRRKNMDQTGSDITASPRKNMGLDKKWHHTPGTTQAGGTDPIGMLSCRL